MVAPSGEGAQRCMKMAMQNLDGRKVDYINTHGTSTPVGDMKEIEALKATFGDGNIPKFSSTKSLTGHSLGATGVQEAIYALLMMKHGFIAGSANIDTLDPAMGDVPVVSKTENAAIDVALSNSFGFGGTNCTLALGKYDG